MSDDIPNLVLDHLRAIRASQEAMREDIREIKTRLLVLEMAFATSRRASIGIEVRLDRIEQRLGLVEAG